MLHSKTRNFCSARNPQLVFTLDRSQPFFGMILFLQRNVPHSKCFTIGSLFHIRTGLYYSRNHNALGQFSSTASSRETRQEAHRIVMSR